MKDNGSLQHYLKAGSRPKNATKVSKDTVTVNMAIARAKAMVKAAQGVSIASGPSSGSVVKECPLQRSMRRNTNFVRL